MYISSNLRYLRETTGLSLRQLEKQSGVPHTVIGRIEKEETLNPGIVAIIELCKVFNVSIDDFIYKNLANELHGHNVHVEKGKEK